MNTECDLNAIMRFLGYFALNRTVKNFYILSVNRGKNRMFYNKSHSKSQCSTYEFYRLGCLQFTQWISNPPVVFGPGWDFLLVNCSIRMGIFSIVHRLFLR